LIRIVSLLGNPSKVALADFVEFFIPFDTASPLVSRCGSLNLSGHRNDGNSLLQILKAGMQ